VFSRITFLIATALFAFTSTAIAQQKVSGGGAFALIVKDDGSVWSVGQNNQGQLGDDSLTQRSTPVQVSGLSNVVAVATGFYHSMALTSSGALYMWGDNEYGQIGNDSTTDRRIPVLISLPSVVAIAAGEYHSVALTATGDAYTWGKNLSGQLGNGSAGSTPTKVPTQVLTGVAAIGAGFDHTLFVKVDGTAWSTGLNGNGQLGDSTTTLRTSPVQMTGITTAVAAFGGERHSVVRLTDGTLVATGFNPYGQIGDGTTTQRLSPVTVSNLTDVVAVAASGDHTFALESDGSLWSWGLNAVGQLGDGTTTNRPTRVEVTAVDAPVHIGAGHGFGIAATGTGEVWTWGDNAFNQLGDGTDIDRYTPGAISDSGYAWRVATPTLSIASGTYTSDRTVVVSVATTDAVIHYTQNGVDPTESDPTVASGSNIVVTYSQTLKAKAFKPGALSSLVTTRIYTLQVVTPSMLPATGTYGSAPTVSMTTGTPGATLRYTTDGVDPTESSTLYSDEFTVGTTTTVKAVGFKSGWSPSAVRANTFTMNFGTLSAPTVTAAGTYEGQVSVEMSSAQAGATIRYTLTGSTPTASSPAYAGPLSVSVTTTVKAKAFHPDYLTSAETSRLYTITATTPTLSVAGGAYAPGGIVTISSPEAGATLRMTLNGSDPTSTSPTVLSGTSMFIGTFTLKVRAFRTGANDSAVASGTYSLTGSLGRGAASAGADHTVYATPDGRVFAFGENGSAQLGDGSTTDRTTAVLIPTLTGVTALSAGAAFTLARTADGQVFAWGLNGSGRLGDGTTTQRTRPVPITTLANVVALAAGDAHGLALTADGRVYAWGENGSGQLGLGSTLDALVPTEITTLTNVVAIAAGDDHSLAVTSSGQVYAWGANGSSRLGDGTTTTRTSPVLLTLSNIATVAAGAAHTVAMSNSGAVYTWGLGSSGQLGHGSTAPLSTPTQVSGLHASAIAAGDNHSAAIRGDGVLVTWGASGSGQIGDGFTTNRTAPTVIASPTSVSTLTLGDLHSAAVSPDGSVWTWGEGASGRLGDGFVADRSTPQAVVTGIAGWSPAAVTVSVPSGWLSSGQMVTLASSTAGATIRYTLDGSEPTVTDDEVPGSGDVEITFSSLLRARAFVEGRTPGAIARADYELQSAAPTISPGTGTYTSAQVVTLSVSGAPAEIRYTIDGTDPTAASSLYSSGVAVNTGLTLKARAFPSNGWAPSSTSTATLSFNYGQLAAPTASVAGGTFADPQTIAFSAASGATIRYTDNGTEPTAASNLYVTPVQVSSGSVLLKAKAFHPDWAPSPVLSESYAIDTMSPTITAHRFPGALNTWHLTPVSVSFTCADNIAIATCSSPATVSSEGAGQTVTGIAIDSAGRQTELVETLNLDLTPPDVTLTSPAEDLVTTSTTVQLTGEVADALSGLVAITCNGEAATVVDGQVSCSLALNPGRNAVVLSARDAAGNSTSAGVMVTRVGTTTEIKLTPETRTMLVGEAATLSLLDDFGAAVASATWTSSSATIVSLSSDDPPVLTALTAGQSTITATKNGLSETATITVVAGVTLEDGTTRLEEGTTRWQTPSTAVPNGQRDRPIYTRRVDATGPDVFTVDTNVTTRERTIRAISSTGDEQWMMVVKGEPLMGDAYGGLVVGVEPSSSYCRAMYGEFENCYKAFTRVPGSLGSMPWRYDSAGYVDRPAQGPDGTIYAIEHLAAIGTLSKSIVILDGATGEVTARVPLANFVTDNNTALSEQEPLTAGPIVGADGLGYLLVSKRKRVIRGAQETMDVGLTLLRLSQEGEVAAEVMEQQHCLSECGEPKPTQLVPDGIGGLLMLTDRDVAPTWYHETRLTRLDSQGAKVDTVVPDDTHIDMVGQAGIAYLRTASGTQAVNVTTMTPMWSTEPEWNLVAAKPDGGAAAQNEAGELGHFSATGELTGPSALGLEDPAADFESLVGLTAGGLTAKAADLANATRFTSTFKKVGSQTWEPQWYGNSQGNSQMRKPGTGIFAKGHNIFGYHHVSLRIVPQNQERWLTDRAADFVNRDEFKNFFATLGAGPVPSGCRGPLVSAINRENDVLKAPTSLELLQYPPSQEDVSIERLFALDSHYNDLLTYECLPDEGTGEYNSNSYIAGLLDAADVPRPSFPTRYGWIYPGWTKPVPASSFVPQ
jgi:alpha-tubulin suppressor-like RCC1 family protein